MAKFVYRMQNILDIKTKMEDQARSAYAQARLRLDEARGKLDGMFAKKSELEQEYRRLASGPLNVRDMLDARKAIDYERDLIKAQLVEIKVCEKNLEVARMRLREVMKERKTQEKLRERAFEEFLLELADQEKKEIDELVSYKYGQAGEQ